MIGAAEIEKAAACNDFVAEAAVAAIPDKIKGEGFVLFAVTKKGVDPCDDLKQKIVCTLKEQIGSLVRPMNIFFVNSLPKTRSGKILRRVLKSIILGKNVGDITTLEDEGCLKQIKEQCGFSC